MHISASYKLKLKLHNLQNKFKLVYNNQQSQFNWLEAFSLSIMHFILKSQTKCEKLDH